MRAIKEVGVVFLDECMQALKSRKAIVLIAAYILFMAIGIKIGSFLELFTLIFTQGRIPFSISLPYYISVFMLPLFAIFITHDAISDDISTRSIRFVASKIGRPAIIFGKFFSAALLTTVMVFLTYIGIAFYVYSKLGEFFFYEAFISWFYLSLYAICLLSIVLLVSSATKSPASTTRLALLVNVVLVGFLYTGYTKWISPFNYFKAGLDFLNNGAVLWVGVLVLLLFTLISLVLTLKIFKRCDL